MSIFNKIKNRLEKLRYRAIENNSKMARPIAYSTRSEDKILPQHQRQLLTSLVWDLIRNDPLAGFVLRKFLQSVSYYRFHAGTPDREFNRKLEAKFRWWMRRENCDACNRHGFEELIYLIEELRAVDGDVGIHKLSNNKIQIIEGDRIRNPPDAQISAEWVNGVKINDYGKSLAYSVFKRSAAGGFEFERCVPAWRFDLLGYYTRADQVRGVSLFAPAAKMFGQLNDALELALGKAKVEQGIALVTHLTSGSALNATTAEDEENRNRALYQAMKSTFGPGVMQLNLQPEEEAKILESNNPSSNFQSFSEMMTRLCFSAFDIPYSFYDGSSATFFSQRGEFEQFIDSIEKKQSATIGMLNQWAETWLIPNWVLEGLELPAEWAIEDIMADCGWSGAGLPTWRLLQNIKEAVTAVQAGIMSPIELAREYGFEPERNLDDIETMRQYAEERGIELPYGTQNAVNIGL